MAVASSSLPDAIHCDLVAPESNVFSGEVWQVIIPGEAGECGVLPGHASLLAALKPGIVRIQAQKNGPFASYFISGGFADVTTRQCSILAEEAIPVDQLDREACEKAIFNLQEDLKSANDNVSRIVIAQKLQLQQAKLAACRS